MAAYLWKVETKQNPRAVREAAKARLAAARARWNEFREKPDSPEKQHVYQEKETCRLDRDLDAWVATVEGGGWIATGVGSSERVAVQRAVESILKAK